MKTYYNPHFVYLIQDLSKSKYNFFYIARNLITNVWDCYSIHKQVYGIKQSLYVNLNVISLDGYKK